MRRAGGSKAGLPLRSTHAQRRVAPQAQLNTRRTKIQNVIGITCFSWATKLAAQLAAGMFEWHLLFWFTDGGF